MPKGIIINNVSNLYKVEIEEIIYTCNIRGRFKKEELTPVVGDYVDIDITDKEKNIGVIEKVFERKTYIKRPKMANITRCNICTVNGYAKTRFNIT